MYVTDKFAISSFTNSKLFSFNAMLSTPLIEVKVISFEFKLPSTKAEIVAVPSAFAEILPSLSIEITDGLEEVHTIVSGEAPDGVYVGIILSVSPIVYFVLLLSMLTPVATTFSIFKVTVSKTSPLELLALIVTSTPLLV